MSRREIVLLVSRAVALLQFIAALVDALTELPQQTFFLFHAMRFSSVRRSSFSISPMAWIGTGFLIRVVVLVIIGALFWHCGPLIERMLLPAGSTPQPSDSAI